MASASDGVIADIDFAQPDPGFEFDQRPIDEVLAHRMGEAQVFGAIEYLADLEGVTLAVRT